MTDKDEFTEKLKSQIDEWSAEIKKLEARAQKVQADTKVQYEENLKKMHEQRDQVQDKLMELQQASDTAWDDMRKGAEACGQRPRKASRRLGRGSSKGGAHGGTHGLEGVDEQRGCPTPRASVHAHVERTQCKFSRRQKLSGRFSTLRMTDIATETFTGCQGMSFYGRQPM